METSFASRVRDFRKFKGLSQQAFAERCGLDQSNITQMEKGTDPKQSNAVKLLAGFPDLNPDWLLLGTGSMLRDNKALTPAPVQSIDSAPALTNGPATVEYANWLATKEAMREVIETKDKLISYLEAQLKKLRNNSDAAYPSRASYSYGAGALALGS